MEGRECIVFESVSLFRDLTCHAALGSDQRKLVLLYREPSWRSACVTMSRQAAPSPRPSSVRASFSFARACMTRSPPPPASAAWRVACASLASFWNGGTVGGAIGAPWLRACIAWLSRAAATPWPPEEAEAVASAISFTRVSSALMRSAQGDARQEPARTTYSAAPAAGIRREGMKCLRLE